MAHWISCFTQQQQKIPVHSSMLFFFLLNFPLHIYFLLVHSLPSSNRPLTKHYHTNFEENEKEKKKIGKSQAKCFLLFSDPLASSVICKTSAWMHLEFVHCIERLPRKTRGKKKRVWHCSFLILNELRIYQHELIKKRQKKNETQFLLHSNANNEESFWLGLNRCFLFHILFAV